MTDRTGCVDVMERTLVFAVLDKYAPGVSANVRICIKVAKAFCVKIVVDVDNCRIGFV